MNPLRILIIFLLLFSMQINSQTKDQLENQKRQILKEIKDIELKLSNSSKKKESIISNAEDINYKITLQQNLISNITWCGS